jgi:peptide/nickel transport system ATP-binding protein
MSESSGPLLEVDALSVGYRSRGSVRHVVSDVSFSVREGSTVAIVGESGSGKSTIANVVLRLAPPNAVVLGGDVRYRGGPLLRARRRALRVLRGNQIAYVPQDPANSLNPVRTIGSQLAESLRATKAEAPGGYRERVRELLDSVGIAQPGDVAAKYPHQLSGGMLQRVLIASAISGRPALLVADEPTSALDVTVQRRVLDLIDELRRALNLSVLLITHDLALAEERCDELVVLGYGRVQEAGTGQRVLKNPRTDYARHLLADVPSLNPDKFGKVTATDRATDAEADANGGGQPAVAVELAQVTKVFRRQGTNAALTALDEVSITVARGSTHAIVGESGSGKTTIARIVVGLERPTKGTVLIDGQPLDVDDADRLRDARRTLQLVYQNPFVSLDPKYTALKSVAEPLARYHVGTKASRIATARELLNVVGLPAHTEHALPRRLSGGQRQRVAIARALALQPEVLVLDEPTNSLDVSVQAQILELLIELQRTFHSTYILISHDLGVVRQVTDSITVLRRGLVIEDGPAAQVFTQPSDPYTRDLILSVPGWRDPVQLPGRLPA